jgi:protein SCO1/2
VPGKTQAQAFRASEGVEASRIQEVLKSQAKVIIMRLIVVILGLLLCCQPLHAADPAPRDVQKKAAPGQAKPLVQTTDKGDFKLELSLAGGKLEPGPNSLDMKVRDKTGLALEGAKIAIIPWMPTMGHGVWDKPVVTERGGGEYHAENIRIIMGGRWDLRITVRKGALEDQATIPFEVSVNGEQAPRKEAETSGEKYERSTASYNVPNVTLLNQDGESVRLRSLTDSGKPVIMDFIFTTCTTVCPVLSAGLASLRSELGDGAAGVQIISVTIDPEHDRPEQLKEYGMRFNAGAGWTFLTGNREEIGQVLKAFDAFIVDKMSHEPLYILRGPISDRWVRIRGLLGVGELMNEFRGIENR